MFPWHRLMITSSSGVVVFFSPPTLCFPADVSDGRKTEWRQWRSGVKDFLLMPNSVGQQQSMGTVPAWDVGWRWRWWGGGRGVGVAVHTRADHWLYVKMGRVIATSIPPFLFYFFCVIGFAMRHLEVPHVAEDVWESEDAHTSSDSTWGPVGGARGEQWLERVTQGPPTPLESQLQLVKGSKL